MEPNPWLDRRVFHWAHGAGTHEAPASTLFAMRTALGHGADGLELDVHATRDGHLVLCHDTSVDRTTDGHGLIADLTLAEVKRLDNAYWWVPGKEVDHDPATPATAYVHRGKAPADAEFQVPTLAEAADAFPGVPLNLELKRPGYEALLARFLLDRDRRDVIVTSFHDRALAAFRAQAPALPTAPGRLAIAAFWARSRVGLAPRRSPHAALQVPERQWRLPVTDGRLVRACHRAGLAVHVWTVNDPVAMRRLVALGVDGIMTNVPSVLETVLQETGTAWVTGG
jgi:glycerophosphoryl diester phosphodiesterase